MAGKVKNIFNTFKSDTERQVLMRELESELYESKEFIRAVTEASPIAFFMTDGKFRPIDCNRKMLEIFNCPGKQYLFDNFWTKLTPEVQPDGQNSAEKAKAYNARVLAGETCVYEWMHTTYDGEPLPVENVLTKVKYGRKSCVVSYKYDLRRMKTMERALLEAEEQARLMLDSGPICAQLWSRDMRIIDCNEAALKLYGFADKQEYIDNWFRLCSPEYQKNGKRSEEAGLEMVKKAFKEGRCVFNWMHQLTDGTPIPSEVTLVRVRYRDSDAVVGYTRDLREELRARREIKENAEKTRALTIQKEAAQAASDAKMRFLANMSHEIRTPMHVVVGMADLLLSEDLNFRQHQYAQDIKTSSVSLLGIINDILDISQIQEGKLNLQPVHYHFVSFINNVISIGKYLITDKSYVSKCGELLCHYEIDDKIPDYLYGDDLRLRQIYLNLLSNAIKYTDGGSVSMTITLQGTEILTAISDTGKGIPGDELPYLFEAFERADEASNRARQGTGLGLAITKSLVELMGGKIWCESVYGEGTTFYFTIPAHEGDASLAAKEEDVSPVYAPNADVLIVDDRELNLNVMHGLLLQCDIESDLATSGPQAIELVNRKPYDLIFMDHMMPDMDGVEAAGIIREMGCHTPIIALTANAVSGAREHMLSGGMNDFLAKPVDKKDLYRILSQWLPAEKITDKPAEPKVMEDDSMDDKLFWDTAAKIEGLSVISGLGTASGNRYDYKNTLRILAREGAKSVTSLKKFLDANDMKNFCTEAHGIKGSLALSGAPGLSAKAKLLEDASRRGDAAYCRNNLNDFNDKLSKLTGDLKKLFDDSERTPGFAPAPLPPGLAGSLTRLSGAMDRMDLDTIFSEADKLGAMRFAGTLDRDIRELIEAVQIMNYDGAKAIIKKLTG